jgi:hypothetical protein
MSTGTHYMKNRAYRHIAAILAISLFATLTVHAGPVTMSGVNQVVGGSGRVSSGSTLRLSTLPTAAESHTSTSDDPGASTDAQQEGPTVQTGEDVIVTQEDCDCEQPPAVGGGFPKWPFLGLIAIPFLFIRRHHHDCTYNNGGVPCTTITPPPTPTPTPPVPEPTTLLLFGSGLLALGAGVRRRYRRDRDQSIDVENKEG